MAKIKIMQKLDDLLFKQCDEFKKSQTYSSLTDANANIDDESRPVVNFLLSSLFFLIPLALVLYFFFANNKLKNNISYKEKIGEEVNRLIELEKRSQPIFSKMVSNPRMESKAQFQKDIQAIAGTIPPSKVSIKNFDQQDLSENISKITARIEFKEINNRDLALFIQNLSIQKKVQFFETSIKKNTDNDLITGVLEVMQFSR